MIWRKFVNTLCLSSILFLCYCFVSLVAPYWEFLVNVLEADKHLWPVLIVHGEHCNCLSGATAPLLLLSSSSLVYFITSLFITALM